MEIGPVTISNPVVLAPMAGVSDFPFRRICRRLGAGLLFTEMINARSLVEASNRRHQNAFIGEGDAPIAAQIFGCDARLLREAALIMESEGATIIDINMGCPVPKVVKKGEGAALMREPAKAGDIVSTVSSAVGVPVTVKIRSGWSQDELNAVELSCLLAAAGAEAITVHARTREAMYSGMADWDVIKRVKQSVNVPVIGNGDLKEPQDGLAMMTKTGCDGLMIGRAALGNPWILRQTYDVIEGRQPVFPSLSDRLSVVLAHMESIRDFRGDRLALLHMRKQAAWYIKGLPCASRFRARFHRADSLEEMKELLIECLGVD